MRRAPLSRRRRGWPRGRPLGPCAFRSSSRRRSRARFSMSPCGTSGRRPRASRTPASCWREPRWWWPRRQVAGGIAAAVVLAGAGARHPRAPAHSIVRHRARGHALQSDAGDVEHIALPGALRDGLNTQLSLLEGVKVYSREFLDFRSPRRSHRVRGGEPARDPQGALRHGHRQGRRRPRRGADRRHRNGYARELVRRHRKARPADRAGERRRRAVIGRLGVELTVADARRLEGFRATDVEAYHRFLATEERPPTACRFRHDATSARGPVELARSAGGVGGRGRRARRDRGLLERYRTAIERAISRHWPRSTSSSPTARRARALLRGDHGPPGEARGHRRGVAGDEAIVSYTRKDDFMDAPTGRPMHLSGRVQKQARAGPVAAGAGPVKRMRSCICDERGLG